MTPRSRAAGLCTALILMALAAGCASKTSPDSTDPTAAAGVDAASGQLGEAAAGGQGINGAAPTPIPTPPVAEVPVTAVPTGGPSMILTVNPTLLLPWPTSPDCIIYSPATASIKFTAATSLWQVISDGNALLAFKQSSDADAGLALVKAYKRLCFIGRNNTRPDRIRYVHAFWMDPVQTSPAIAAPDCLPHVGSQLVVTDAGTLGWRVGTSSESIALYDTKADADNAVLVMKHYNRHCYIGRSYAGADRLNYITDWYANV